MENQKSFSVALRAFSQDDVGAIHRIFKLSEARPRVYELINGEGYDILIVNAPAIRPGDIRAHDTMPILWVGEKADKERPYCIDRPILSSRLLRMLDKITVNELHFIPEINIGVRSVHDRAGLTSGGDANWSFEQAGMGAAVSDSDSAHRVLVADDSQVVRTQLKLILDNLGISADFAQDGMQALNKLSKRRYDLILMDIVMPNMDGLEATKKIKKELDGQGPVIMLTAKTSHIDRLRGAFAGCDTYLTKPLNQQELVEVLRKHLDIGKTADSNSPDMMEADPSVS